MNKFETQMVLFVIAICIFLVNFAVNSSIMLGIGWIFLLWGWFLLLFVDNKTYYPKLSWLAQIINKHWQPLISKFPRGLQYDSWKDKMN